MKTHCIEFDHSAEQIQDLMTLNNAIGWGPFDSVEIFARELAEREDKEGLRLFVALHRGKVVGFVELCEKNLDGLDVAEHQAYIHAMAASPDVQQARVSKKFGKQVLKQLSAEGFRSACTDIRWDNIASQRLAAACGAKLSGISPQCIQFHRDAPHLRMSFDLAS